MVASEGSASSIGAAKTWRQTDDQQPCVTIAEGRNRAIVPVRLGDPPLLTKGNKPRAKLAISWRLGLQLTRLTAHRARLKILRQLVLKRRLVVGGLFGVARPPLLRIPSDLAPQREELDEVIRLPAQLIGDNRWLGRKS